MSSVRLADRSDFARIVELDDRTKYEVNPSNEYYVVDVDDDIQAYAECTIWFHHRPFIAKLFVHAKHRRQGLGDGLLAHIESICSHDKLWTSTVLINVPMQRLLHKRGYRMAGVIDHLGNEPELIYYKKLADGES